MALGKIELLNHGAPTNINVSWRPQHECVMTSPQYSTPHWTVARGVKDKYRAYTQHMSACIHVYVITICSSRQGSRSPHVAGPTYKLRAHQSAEQSFQAKRLQVTGTTCAPHVHPHLRSGFSLKVTSCTHPHRKLSRFEAAGARC